MSEVGKEAIKKDRSPSYPFVALEDALKRVAAFEQTFGRHPTPAIKSGLAWGMKEKSSQASQVLAALKSFGLVDYAGSGDNRMVSLTNDARTFLRAQQDGIKKNTARQLALKPKLIAQFWRIWGEKRPIDAVCLDDLILKHAFTDGAARNFLRVYDATIAFAGLTDSDTMTSVDDEEDQVPVPPNVSVGDLVQIEIGGAFALEKPKRVRAINEHEGQNWVFIEGTETGFEMSQVVLQETAPVAPVASKAPPRLALDDGRHDIADAPVLEGWSEETLIDDNGGEIKIRYEGKASLKRYEFIHDYLAFKISRLKPKT